MEKPSYFSILTADVRYDRRLGKPNARELYSEITALSNKDGYVMLATVILPNYTRSITELFHAGSVR